jgi:hypothetical protein
MVSMLASCEVDRRFKSQSGQTKDYRIGNYCFSTKHAVVRRKSKEWLARNQEIVSEWGELSIRGLVLDATTMPKQTQIK